MSLYPAPSGVKDTSVFHSFDPKLSALCHIAMRSATATGVDTHHDRPPATYMRISSSVAREPILPDAAPGSARAAASRCIASCGWIWWVWSISTIAASLFFKSIHPATAQYPRTGSSSIVAAWMEQRGAKLPVKKEVSTSKPKIRPGKASLMMLQSWPGLEQGIRCQAPGGHGAAS